MRIIYKYHWQGTCVKKGGILGVHFYIHGVQFMYTSKYTYATFHGWAPVLTNRYILESTFTYIWYILEISSLCIKLSIEHFAT